jgi:putative ABC transport system permease protein
MSPGESVVAPAQVAISPGFFEAMGVGLVSGRFFDQRDRGLTPAGTPAVDSSQPRVAIVDDRLARRFWSGQSPIGRRLYMPTDPKDLNCGHRAHRLH